LHHQKQAKKQKMFIAPQNMVVKLSQSLYSITILELYLPTISGMFLNLLGIAPFPITDLKRRIVHGEKD